MRHSSYYARVTGGISMSSETSTFMYIYINNLLWLQLAKKRIYFNYNLLKKDLVAS